MVIYKAGFFFAAAVFASPIIGCGGIQETFENQASPREVLKKVHVATVDGDKEKFLECFVGVDDHPDLFDTLYDFRIASFKLYQKVTAEYGSDAWQEFVKEKSPSYSDKADFRLLVPPFNEPWWQDVEIKRQGTREAVWTNPWLGKEDHLVYDDVWKLDPIRGASNIPALTKVFKKFTEVIRVGIRDAGKPGVSVDELKQRMVSEVFKGRKGE